MASMKGYLKKKKPQGVIKHAWQKRYFVLTEMSISYYKDQKNVNEGATSGVVGLDKIRNCTVLETSHGGARFDINVMGGRVFSLLAKTPEESKAWVVAINQNLKNRKTASAGNVNLTTASKSSKFWKPDLASNEKQQTADLRQMELKREEEAEERKRMAILEDVMGSDDKDKDKDAYEKDDTLKSSIVPDGASDDEEEEADGFLDDLTPDNLKVKPDSVREGYMKKQGSGHKNWKTRYFILTKTHLKYYSSKGGHKCGEIKVTEGGVVASHWGALHGYQYLFTLNATYTERTYYFVIAHDTSRSGWIDAIDRTMNPNVQDLRSHKQDASLIADSPPNGAPDVPDTIKKGYLVNLRQESGGTKAKKRWFVLIRNQLRFYKVDKETNEIKNGAGEKPPGLMKISSNSRVTAEQLVKYDVPYCISIIADDESTSWVLVARTDEERTAWIKAFTKAIGGDSVRVDEVKPRAPTNTSRESKAAHVSIQDNPAAVAFQNSKSQRTLAKQATFNRTQQKKPSLFEQLVSCCVPPKEGARV